MNTLNKEKVCKEHKNKNTLYQGNSNAPTDEDTE